MDKELKEQMKESVEKFDGNFSNVVNAVVATIKQHEKDCYVYGPRYRNKVLKAAKAILTGNEKDMLRILRDVQKEYNENKKAAAGSGEEVKG